MAAGAPCLPATLVLAGTEPCARPVTTPFQSATPAALLSAAVAGAGAVPAALLAAATTPGLEWAALAAAALLWTAEGRRLRALDRFAAAEAAAEARAEEAAEFELGLKSRRVAALSRPDDEPAPARPAPPDGAS
jgi:hypothetical protein